MTASRDDEARKLSWFDEGQRALHEGRTDAALNKLGVAARMQPGAATYALLARARARRKEWVDTARLAAAAIGMGDATATTRLALADALDRLGQSHQADRWRAAVAPPPVVGAPPDDDADRALALQVQILATFGDPLATRVPASDALAAAGARIAAHGDKCGDLPEVTRFLNASLPTQGGPSEATVVETFVSALAVSKKAVKGIRAGLKYPARQAFDQIVRFGAQALDGPRDDS